ncbi:MAG: beta-ketoacyl-[acyl-carrier-protein] synthase family protein, partial [Candidatus Eremiobacteraeota bacterium]|nr:beta-ketoacyl-[acyl-carrier-protein] synthase family protein [Candidatus Eremiobacteraeota bacterium]
EAFRAIGDGYICAAIAGGVEAPLAPLTYGAFTVARAMSTRNDDPSAASRPFDRDRDGFVMAEGAGFVVLERLDDALRRGAQPYMEITGFGVSNDAHHMAAPLADGSETARAMQNALDDARISAGEVEGINAHGSSTQAGDRAEIKALASVFGERLPDIPTSATKGQHGHALGATGAWEIAVSALTFRHGCVPGNVNFTASDDDAYIGCANEAKSTNSRIVLKNSSGFGGINAALVMESC